ncbi:MAG: hypothetical protein WKG07_31860 [Hymenobacter sp.]
MRRFLAGGTQRLAGGLPAFGPAVRSSPERPARPPQVARPTSGQPAQKPAARPRRQPGNGGSSTTLLPPIRPPIRATLPYLPPIPAS